MKNSKTAIITNSWAVSLLIEGSQGAQPMSGK